MMSLQSRSSCIVSRTIQISRRGLHVSCSRADAYRFVVCGGGTGGLAVASSLARRFGEKHVAVIEPSDVSNTLHVVCL